MFRLNPITPMRVAILATIPYFFIGHGLRKMGDITKMNMKNLKKKAI